MARQPHLRIHLTTTLVGLALLASACGEQRDVAVSEPAEVGDAVVWMPPVVDVRSGIPEVDSCHQLPRDVTSGDDASSTTTVPCSDPHTSRTYLADVIPTHVAEDPQRWVATRCSDAFPDAVGLTPEQVPGAFVEWVWVQPDAEMRRAGARWYRCDVRVNRPGNDLDLPGEQFPLFPEGVPDRWLRCVDTTSASSADGASYVSCDQPHQFRWAGSLPAPDGDHPSPAAWEALAAANCRDIVGPDAFWFTYPNRVQWRDGDHRLSCYRKV